MDTLFHFIFPIIAALATRIKIKHPVRTLLLAAFLTVLVDFDHFVSSERLIFHNVFVVLIPLILLFLSFHFKSSRFLKGFFLILLIFLSSHIFLDLFSSPVFGEGIRIAEGKGEALFYPLSTIRYSIDFNFRIPIGNSQKTIEAYMISSLGFGILMYSLIIILPSLFFEDIIEITEKKHEKFRKASKEFFRRLLKD